MEPAEYAPPYSRAERLRILVSGIVIGGLAVGLGKVWFFPWVARFSATAPCSTVLGVNGATVLWYSLFVALPLLVAIVVALCYGHCGLAVLRSAQFPPPGSKVFRPTRIVKGAAGRRIGYLQLAAFVPFLALALWGSRWAADLSKHSGATRCTPGGSFKPELHRVRPDSLTRSDS